MARAEGQGRRAQRTCSDAPMVGSGSDAAQRLGVRGDAAKSLPHSYSVPCFYRLS